MLNFNKSEKIGRILIDMWVISNKMSRSANSKSSNKILKLINIIRKLYKKKGYKLILDISANKIKFNLVSLSGEDTWSTETSDQKYYNANLSEKQQNGVNITKLYRNGGILLKESLRGYGKIGIETDSKETEIGSKSSEGGKKAIASEDIAGFKNSINLKKKTNSRAYNWDIWKKLKKKI